MGEMTNDRRSRAGNRHKALIDKETFEKTQNSIIYKEKKENLNVLL